MATSGQHSLSQQRYPSTGQGVRVVSGRCQLARIWTESVRVVKPRKRCWSVLGVRDGSEN